MHRGYERSALHDVRAVSGTFNSVGPVGVTVIINKKISSVLRMYRF